MLNKEKLEFIKEELINLKSQDKLILNIINWIDNKIKECDEIVEQLNETLDFFKKEDKYGY